MYTEGAERQMCGRIRDEGGEEVHEKHRKSRIVEIAAESEPRDVEEHRDDAPRERKAVALLRTHRR